MEPTVDDALKIEDEIKNENDNFLDTSIDFNKVHITTSNQKKHDFHSEFFDAVVDLSLDVDHMPITEGVFIDDDLFCNTDIKAKDKQNIGHILQPVNHSDIRIAQPIFEIKEKNRLKPAKKRI